jgi:hypothetical protein
MKTKKLFLLAAALVLAILTLASCGPAAATNAPTVEPTALSTFTSTAEATAAATDTPTVEPTALPTITSTAEATPVSTITATAIAQASGVGSFPSGKFVDVDYEASWFVFTEDGRWSHWLDGFRSASGTYRVEGNTYFQLTLNPNPNGCPPTSFKFSFDGTLLEFQLTEESSNDACPDRTGWYENKTYILSP